MAFAAHAPLADNGFGKVESNRKNASRRQPDQELRINEEDRFATTRDVLIVRGGARAGGEHDVLPRRPKNDCGCVAQQPTLLIPTT
jgi:hypothetical protein